jgi:hypothetical protein
MKPAGICHTDTCQEHKAIGDDVLCARHRALQQARYKKQFVKLSPIGVSPILVSDGGAKLSEAQVREIWQRAHGGETLTKLALAFGISISQISGIKNGRAWRNVTKDLKAA